MSEVKERIIGALTIMPDVEAEKIWTMIQQNFGVGFEEVDPTDDEKEVMEAYRRGDEEYQPYMTMDEVEKMFLG